MKTDARLQQNSMDELTQELAVDAAETGVKVQIGDVTLVHQVRSFTLKHTARWNVQAAQLLGQFPSSVRTRLKTTSAVLGVLAAVCLVPQAQAAIPPGYKVSYTYTGNPTTHQKLPIRAPEGIIYSVTEQAGRPILVRFLFDDYLPSNSTVDRFSTGPRLLNAAIPRNQLTYFSIYDAQSGLTRGGSVNGRFLTDSTGQIAAWRFGLGSGGPSASSSEDSNFLPNSEVTDIRTIRLLDDPLYYHFNTNTPGVWAVAMIVPEPAGWMMILAGLPVVGCAAAYSRRRRGWECSPCV